MATVPPFTPGDALQQTDLQFLLTPPQSFTYQATPQAALANNVSTAVTWDTGAGAGISYDTDPTSWAAGSPTRVTLNTSGKWLFLVRMLWVANATSMRQIDLRKNSGGSGTGGTRIGIDIHQASASGSTTNGIAVEFPGLVAGDYVEVFALQVSGGALAFLSSNFPGAVGITATWQGV